MIDRELIPVVAMRFKALAEPARLEILACLQEGERSVSELAAATGRGQPNVSQHLKELTHAGLLAARRDGTHVYYRIADRYVTRICDAVCKSVSEARRAVASGGVGPRQPRRATRGSELGRG